MMSRKIAGLSVAMLLGAGLSIGVGMPAAHAAEKPDFSNVESRSDTVPDRHPGAFPCGDGCWEDRRNR